MDNSQGLTCLHIQVKNGGPTKVTVLLPEDDPMPLAKVLLYSNYRLYLHAPCNQVKMICPTIGETIN